MEWRDNQKQRVLFACAYQFGDQYKDDVATCVYIQVNIHKGQIDLRIITQPHSQVYWGYFRRLVFGNSSTKHNKLTYFSNSILFCSDVLLPFSHIPRCIHAKTPDFPRLFEPRE